VADALYQSANEAGTPAFCFDPHHVIRAFAGGLSLDFIICFECDDMHVHDDPSDAFWSCPISKAAQKVLNNLLMDEGVPLAR
jgi:hypothetical protein